MILYQIILNDKQHKLNTLSILEKQNKKFCLSLHYNWSNNFLFVNGLNIYQFKTKDFGINAYSLYLGNILENLTVHNMKITGLYGYVYDFSVEYKSYKC